jgi:hypothetical protein
MLNQIITQYIQNRVTIMLKKIEFLIRKLTEYKK